MPAMLIALIALQYLRRFIHSQRHERYQLTPFHSLQTKKQTHSSQPRPNIPRRIHSPTAPRKNLASLLRQRLRVSKQSWITRTSIIYRFGDNPYACKLETSGVGAVGVGVGAGVGERAVELDDTEREDMGGDVHCERLIFMTCRYMNGVEAWKW